MHYRINIAVNNPHVLAEPCARLPARGFHYFWLDELGDRFAVETVSTVASGSTWQSASGSTN